LILSNLSYVSASVEYLGPSIPQFSNQDPLGLPTPPITNQIDAPGKEWRNQSPNETRATAQYRTNHNYDNCKLKLALELFGRPRGHFY